MKPSRIRLEHQEISGEYGQWFEIAKEYGVEETRAYERCGMGALALEDESVRE